MNLLERICEELGIEIGEIFKMKPAGEDKQSFRLDTIHGLEVYNKEVETWVTPENHIYNAFITGRLKPVWKPKRGDLCYIPFIYKDEIERYHAFFYEDYDPDTIQWYLENNLLFKTKGEAIAVTNKMLEILKEEDYY